MTTLNPQNPPSEDPGVMERAAQAVVDALGAYSWEEEASPRRRWIPTYDLDNMLGRLIVDVVPSQLTLSAATRSTTYYDAQIEIGLLRKPDPVDYPTPDAMRPLADAQVALAERIALFFRDEEHRLLVPGGGLTVTGSQVSSPLLLDPLEESGQLISVVTLTVRERRE